MAYFDLFMYISGGIAILSLLYSLFSSGRQRQAGFTFLFSLIAMLVFWFLWRF